MDEFSDNRVIECMLGLKFANISFIELPFQIEFQGKIEVKLSLQLKIKHETLLVLISECTFEASQPKIKHVLK